MPQLPPLCFPPAPHSSFSPLQAYPPALSSGRASCLMRLVYHTVSPSKQNQTFMSVFMQGIRRTPGCGWTRGDNLPSFLSRLSSSLPLCVLSSKWCQLVSLAHRQRSQLVTMADRQQSVFFQKKHRTQSMVTSGSRIMVLARQLTLISIRQLTLCQLLRTF